MTRQSQKDSERFYVKEAAKLMNVSWKIIDREKPDFFITEGIESFGLEVCEIFKGQTDARGSFARRAEAFMDDISIRIGWVARNPEFYIDRAIKKKSQMISQYKSNIGQDIRLLLIANRLRNSGKIALPQNKFFLNTQGFKAVYFYSYPDGIVKFDDSGAFQQ